MTEPTLLQQARQYLERSHMFGGDTANAARDHALYCILKHLEQREAASAGVVKCKECGRHREHWVHDLSRVGYTDPEHPELASHAFGPEMLADRVAALEAMSESHTHNIASLFLDIDTLQKRDPAQVPSEPKCKVCGHVADSAPHRWGSDDFVKHDFEPDIALCDHLAAQGEPKPPCAVCGRLTGGCCTTKKEPSTDVLDLDALQRLCDAATPGPWRLGRLWVTTADGLSKCLAINARFVEIARDALPKLIARVRELEAKR